MKPITIVSLLFFLLLTVGCSKDNAPKPVPSPANDSIIETKAYQLQAQRKRVNAVIGGFYSGLPSMYDITTKSYPLLIFIHGAGQFGDGNADIQLLLKDAIPKLMADNNFPPNFTVGSDNFSFIMLAPQFSKTPTNEELKSFIDYAKINYRVDASRIYLTGLSMGAVASNDYMAAYPMEIAAAVTMSGSTTIDIVNKTKTIADNKIGLWAFHNEADQIFNPLYTKDFVNVLNNHNPVIKGRLTVFSTAPANNHDSWTAACNPSYRESGKNIYEWMLQFKK